MQPKQELGSGVYTVTVDNNTYTVEVNEGGDVTGMVPVNTSTPLAPTSNTQANTGEPITAPLAGLIFKISVSLGQMVEEGDVIVVLEAMKMETELRAPRAGRIESITVSEGDSVDADSTLYILS